MQNAREKNAEALATPREHGTYARYVKDRCRCEDCLRARRDYDAGAGG